VTQAPRLLREDIIDKVLERDMSALFGVRRALDLQQHGVGGSSRDYLPRSPEKAAVTAGQITRHHSAPDDCRSRVSNFRRGALSW
jgi:hypothetical protein